MEIKKKGTASLQKAVLLKGDDVLVELIPDYYAPKKSGGFNSHVAEDDPYSVGVIRASGSNNADHLGKVIYFVRDSGTVMHMGDPYGKLHKLNVAGHGHLIRLDESVTINNQ